MLKNTTKNNTNLPIGIFDSGLGGLSICKEIINLLPYESVIYLADSANAPYGDKSKEEIIELSIKNTTLLLELGCKIIVVACNTATTNAINILRKKFNVPFIGIEPAIKLAALCTKTGKIGVLATAGTLKSDLFISTSEQFRNSLEIIETRGENLVRLIESGNIEKTKPLLAKYLMPMVDKGADNIVLGCTHYPFLIPLIKQIVPNNVVIIDSGRAVAKQTLAVLNTKKMLRTIGNGNTTTFYTNKGLTTFQSFLNLINIASESVFFRDF